MKNSIVNITREVELSGWWTGRAVVDDVVDDLTLEEFFDMGCLDESDKSIIKAISQETDEEKSYTSDIVPACLLSDSSREQIANQIMNGNMFGDVWNNGKTLRWSWSPEVTIDGISIDFQNDLSEVSKAHIVNEMLNNEYHAGEINETDTICINVEIEPDENSDNGIFIINIEYERFRVLSQKMNTRYIVCSKTGDVDINDDIPAYNEVIAAIKSLRC